MEALAHPSRLAQKDGAEYRSTILALHGGRVKLRQEMALKLMAKNMAFGINSGAVARVGEAKHET